MHEKRKGHTISHKCRCSSILKSSSSSSSTRSTATTSTNTIQSHLRNIKDLPVREYDKLSPIPQTSLNCKFDTSSVAEIKSLNDKMCSPKAVNYNGNNDSPLQQTNKTATKICSANVSPKPNDALILRIGSLDKSARRLSSLSINRENDGKSKGKIKVRTKTDPHPISSSQKLRNLSSSGTLATVSITTHSSSKCNCSSCKSISSSVSNSDNHNKTKSVGTQHDANIAYDPWVRQSDTKCGGKSSSSAISKLNSSPKLSSVLTHKLAHTNAKVIVITDDFKKKALDQQIYIDTKRKMLRYMKANKLTNSLRSMDDDNDTDEPTKVNKQKAISKSVDNVSQLSTELEQLDNVGSVELIFISDEYLNNVAKPDVIILVSVFDTRLFSL